MEHLFGYSTEQLHISKESKNHYRILTLSSKEEGRKVNLSLVISEKVEISPKNFQTFSLKSFATHL